MKHFALICVVTTATLLAITSSAVELISCPETAPKDHVVLQSTQNKCIQLKTEIAKQSGLIGAMIEDLLGDTSHVIPMHDINDSQLKDIATIWYFSFQSDKGIRVKSDIAIRSMLLNMTKNAQTKLISLINAANYLDLKLVLNNALDVLSLSLLDSDLANLGTLKAKDYGSYKEKVLQSIPKNLVPQMLRRVSSWFPPTLIATLTSNDEKSDDVFAVAFSADRKYILTGNSKGMNGEGRLWDANVKGHSAKPLAVFKHDVGVVTVEFSPNSQLALTGDMTGTAKLWDVNTRGEKAEPLAILRHNNKIPLEAVFSADSKSILTSSGDVKLWSANVKSSEAKPLAIFPSVARLQAIGLGPDGKAFWIATLDPQNHTKADLWDISAIGNHTKPSQTFYLAEGSNVKVLKFSQNGKAILMIDKRSPKEAGLLDLTDKGFSIQHTTLKPGEWINDARFSSDDKRIVMVSSKEVTVWDLSKRGGMADKTHPLIRIQPGATSNVAALSSDEKRIVIGTVEGATLWDLQYADQLTLPAAQVILYAWQNNLTAAKLPNHLLNELDVKAKAYLPQK